MLYTLLASVAIAIGVVFFLYTRSLIRARAESSESEQRFEQMAGNIQEIFWMIDVKTKKILYVNPAYEIITGRSCQSLKENPCSYEAAIHPEDRARVLGKLDEATTTGQFDERFRIVLPNDNVRWVSAHGFPVRDSKANIQRLVGTVQDITTQRQAEEEVANNLELAKSAWEESEALRKATLALTQDLRMDVVLDTLLQSLTELVSCDSARIWLLEGETRLFVAREKLSPNISNAKPHYPMTLDAADIPFLHRILGSQKSVLLRDTKQEADWNTFRGHSYLRSWLCIPLVASKHTLGLLSIGHTQVQSFTKEDLRRAQLLAIPAAAAIQNSRLYECAAIYGSELEKRVTDLHEAKSALEHAEESRRVSEEKFRKVFRVSPAAFSISTIVEGRFVDVNAAFERRYGYSRTELIGQTVSELGMWEDPGDRVRMLEQLQRGSPVRSLITRLRTKSGGTKITTYSADQIEFDGQSCLLAVSEDQHGDPRSN